MRWFWGSILLLIGLILLGNNLGLWHQIFLSDLWIYWPLILIILGVSILTRHWRFGYLVMVLLVLASLGFIYFTGVVGQRELATTSSEIIKTNINRDVPEGIKKAKIIIDSGAVKVSIAGSTDSLVSGSYESNRSTKPSITESVSGDMILYTIKTDKSFDSWNHGNVTNTLNLKLSSAIPIELEIDAKASGLDLDLKEQKISSLVINSGASILSLTLGSNIENGARVSIQSGASKLNIKVPKEIGAGLSVRAPLTSSNLENLEQQDRGKYYTENFASATKKISFEINAGASSIDFSSY